MKVNSQIAVAVAVAVHEAQKRIPDDLRGQSFFGQYDLWQYIAITDDRACGDCLWLDTRFFMGDEIRQIFPYLEIIDENTIKTHSHMPRDDNCRCELHRITEPSHYISITKEKP